MPSHAQDTPVLDELVRLDIDSGDELLKLRDDLAICLNKLSANGILTRAESGKAMRGLSLAVQILRTEVADKYRELAEGMEEKVDELDDQRQPVAVYKDPKDRG